MKRKAIAKMTTDGSQAFIRLLKGRLDDPTVNMSQAQLCQALEVNGMVKVNQDVISKLVGGRLARLNFFLVCAIARTIGFPHPAKAGEYYSLDDLFEICCSLRDARTGSELTPRQRLDRVSPNPFVSWLTEYLADRGVGDVEFMLIVQQGTNINGLDLQSIMRGDRLPTNAELQELTAILDHEDGSMYTFAELEQIRDRRPNLPPTSKKTPNSKSQGQRTGANKGRPRAITVRGDLERGSKAHWL